MQHFSLAVEPPARTPYDRSEELPGGWYDSFLGNIVLPTYETGKLSRFWFSQYGTLGHGPHAKFRFSTEQFSEVDAVLSPLIQRYGLTLLPEHEHVYPHPFDIIGDLVPPNDPSHFGTNKRITDRSERGELLYCFLHASALVTLNCLSHRDAEGRWYREANPDNNNTQFGDTMESIHHLFCNSSNVPTAVCLVPVAGQIGPPFHLLSPLYTKIAKMFTPSLQVIPVKF